MRALLAGMGVWGALWHGRLARRPDIELAGVVDLNPEIRQKLKEGARFHTDAGAAMDQWRPDFVLNATPPAAHRKINELAFDRDIPVLCEKPIAEAYDDVLAAVSRAQKGQKLMIAENNRYTPHCRLIRDILARNAIGKLTDIRIDVQVRHFIENYHKGLEHPMLLDVGIHHLDMLRFFTGGEAKRVYADFHTPDMSWYKGYSNATLCLAMENGVRAVYQGRLDAHADYTTWYGNWVFSGEKGRLRYERGGLYLETGGQTESIPLPENGDAEGDAMLDAFLAYIRRGTRPETHISDNVKTHNIAEAAIRSFKAGKEWDIGLMG